MDKNKQHTMYLTINDKKLPLNHFVREIITNVNVSLIETLKIKDDWDQFTITIKRT